MQVYSRVVGYYAEVDGWNIGKQEEFKDRQAFDPVKALEEKEEKSHNAV
jgi:ribonucleoside-triphosphate reductase